LSAVAAMLLGGGKANLDKQGTLDSLGSEASKTSARRDASKETVGSTASKPRRAHHSVPRAPSYMLEKLSGVGDMSARITESAAPAARIAEVATVLTGRSYEDYLDESTIRTGSSRRMSWMRGGPPEGGLELVRYRVQQLCVNRGFDTAIGLVIVANSVTIGCELTRELEGQPTHMLEWFESLWLVIYVIELLLRFFGWGVSVWKNPWVRFDTVLVIVGIINTWVMKAVRSGSKDWAFLMVLRLMRLGRLARTVRLLVKFRVLWMLVRGLLSSAGTMFYTMVLVTIMLYVFGAMAIELITNNALVDTDAEFRSIVEANFSSLWGAMLTLVQFVCLDSISTIYRPLIQKAPYLLIYFAGVILVVPIVLMNLVTAIVVNSALDQAAADREAAKYHEEARKARLVKQLKNIFLRLDTDNSGQLSREELSKIESEDCGVLYHATSICDPLEIFNALNVDGWESLSIDDFCDGIWKLATSKATIEVQRMEKQVSTMFRRLKSVEANYVDVSSSLHQIAQNQENMQKMLASICLTIKRADRLALAGSAPDAAVVALLEGSGGSSARPAAATAAATACAGLGADELAPSLEHPPASYMPQLLVEHP